MKKQIALVTGANRGIGYEVVKQLAQASYQVILTGRDSDKVNKAASELAGQGLAVEGMAMEVTDESSVKELAEKVLSKYGHLNVIINNAGGNFDYDKSVSQMDLKFASETLELNLLSAWRVSMAFLPLLIKVPGSRIVNVASGAGSHADTNFGLTVTGGSISAYGVSKCALNALTCKFATELKKDGILVNSVCPGFTATYPGAEAQGARPVKDGAASVVWAATLPPDGPTGGFFRDGKTIGW